MPGESGSGDSGGWEWCVGPQRPLPCGWLNPLRGSGVQSGPQKGTLVSELAVLCRGRL